MSQYRFTSKRKDNLAQHIRESHDICALGPVGIKNGEGLSPAKFDDENIVLNGDIIDTKKNPAWTLLMDAASTGNVSLIQDLIQRGMDVNASADDGYSALHCAARGGQETTVRYLLDIEPP
jgi:ankyrin repeat protein